MLHQYSNFQIFLGVAVLFEVIEKLLKLKSSDLRFFSIPDLVVRNPDHEADTSRCWTHPS